MILLAVDPGIRGCGLAVFNDRLIHAAYVKNTSIKGAGPRECATMAAAIHYYVFFLTPAFNKIDIDLLALEWPTMYKGRAARGDVRDLLPLAGVDAAIAALYPHASVTHYVPREWKSNIDPDVMIERIKLRLRVNEQPVVVLPSAKSLHHNVWDAIGIGMYHLGRFEKKRVYARS